MADTKKFYGEIQASILARYNRTYDLALQAKMMGRKALEAAKVFVEETGISHILSAEDFLVEREAMLRDKFPMSELMPGRSIYFCIYIVYFVNCLFIRKVVCVAW